ncbi:hypothetical protein ASC75_24125 [Aminobacter sp. DSM 101952]|uniref:DUF5801 repeats-in-toxin domain-containing protein n=1 Tax=Aminobacter sp. DSM 101952 TaxID=2735891 RepID=UPI0006FFBAB4|nr:DUF5801 repeats-in-toxin domain-containing protein [Aminobacter sp. DSM 101952]KQU71853.1 hypothetical protein ASC75_24125 [Aminobacter sp. DSM 101952]
MATSIEFENVSGAAEGASAAGTVQLAQAEGVSPQQPAAQADPVPVDAGSGQPVQQTQPAAAAPAEAQAEYVADASNVVHLPANVSIDNIKVDGDNLVLEQADGSVIVIKDAAANVPTFLLGDVEVPRVALIAALEAGGINVAFGADGSISAASGSTSSSGGNFELPAGGIGNGFDLSALLPPTALAFPQYDGRELTLGENADPEFAGFSIRLSEEGLQGGIKDGSGSPDDRSDSPVYTGNFGATDPNGDSLTYSLGLPTTPGLSSGGQPITWELVGPNLLVGKIDGGEGPDQEIIRLEITNPGTGAFEVTILGPIDHPEQGAEDVVGIDVPVTVKDPNGGSATANVTIEIEDDSPKITSVGLGGSAVVDETTAGTTAGYPVEVTSGSPVLDLDAHFGADGAAAGGGISYALSLTGGVSTLKTAIGDFPISLVQVDPTTIAGVYQNNGQQTAFTVKINANGTLTVTQNVPLEHNADGDTPAAHDDFLSLSGLVNATVTITDFDNDSVFGGAQVGGLIRFYDDGPSVSENAVVLLDDDAMDGGNAGTPAVGDDDDGANTSGTLGFDFGADGGSVAWLVSGAPTGFEYKPGTNGALEVFQNGTKVLTVTLDSATGAYTVTQNAPIQHATGGNENNQIFNLTYQVTDNDGDTANGTLQINVDDDTPTIAGSGEGPVLTVDDSSLGTNATASFANNFVASYGADGPGSVTYALSVVAGVSGLTDTATGQQVVLSMNNGVVEGRTAVGNSLVFTVKVNANGDVTLDQIRSVRHENTNDHDDARSLAEDLVKLTATVTDADGDSQSATLNIGDNLVFKDDGPSVKPGDASVKVDEDDLWTAFSHGTSPDGDTEWFTGAAKATGSVAGLVNFGTDGAAAGGGFGFTATAADQMEALGLQSKGSPLSYAVVGNTLVAFVDNGNGHYDLLQDRPVFTMTLDGDGDFTFRLLDQLDHVAPPSGANQNEDLQANGAPVSSIDFGSVIQATDRDGDSVTLSGKVNVTVVDDIPQVHIKATGAAVTHDETAGLQGDDADPSVIADRFASLNQPAALGYAHQGNVVSYGADAFEPGADEPITMSIALALNGGNGTDSGLKTTSGSQISLYLVDGLIVGRVDNADGSANPNGQIAFAVALDQDGGVSIAQYLSLEHPKQGNGSQNSHDEPVNLGNLVKVVLTATDNDGDTVEKSVTIGNKIVFEDDSPRITAPVAGAGVVHDETPGNDPDANDNGTISPLNVNNPGSDPHVNGGVGPIGVAQSQGAIVTANVDYGADGAGGLTYALNIGAASTTLLTTEGRAIQLFNEGGIIVGRFDAAGGQIDQGDPAAFAVGIDPVTGVVTLVQYVSLQHPTQGSSHDEELSLAANNIRVVLTARDGDGDTTSATVNVGNAIKFEDDGPKLISVVPTVPALGDELVVNGSFELGHGNVLGGQDWEIFHQLPGWNSGGNVPFEVQTGGAGGIGAPVGGGTAVVELDSDTEGNPANGNVGDINPTGDTNATIQQVVNGTEAGQTYQLTFYYSPRGDATTAGMKVTFGGVEVFNSSAGNYQPGTWYPITVTVTAPVNNAVLAFTGTGAQDEVGALLDKVSLKAVYTTTIDDENVPGGAAGIPGGPGDDGAGNVATGKINFDAGSDGLKSIAATGVAGLQAIYVDPTTNVGTQYNVNNQAWVANGAGGTLTGTMDVPNVGTVTVYTLTIDASGNYTLTMLQPLVHSVTDNPATSEEETSFEDNRPLDFGFTITDGDGDTATGTVAISVDDDSPEFVNGGIEDGAVSAYNTAVTGDLNLAFGEDGQHATDGLRITGWPELEGVTTTLSGDGKTLTATIGGQGGATLYTLQLNGDGTYTFNQVNSLPGGGNTLPEVSVSSGFGPTATKDYEGFTLKGLDGGLLSGSGDGIGIGNNGMNPGEKFAIVYDVEMTSAKLGVNHFGNGTVRLDWVAKDQDGNIVASGSSADFSSDGTVTITPPLGEKFFSLEVTTVGVDGPAPKFKLISVGGETHGDAVIDKLNFQVTGKDGDGDSVSDAFDIKLGGSKPVAIDASAAVDDDGLSGANTGGLQDIAVPDNDNDGKESTFSGALQGSGGDGALVFSFAGMSGQSAQVGQEMVSYSLVGNTLTATVSGAAPGAVAAPRTGQVLFEIVLNPNSGHYDLALKIPVLHANADNSEASVSVIPPITFTVGDSDTDTSAADTDTGTLAIEFNDDVPIAGNHPGGSFVEGSATQDLGVATTLLGISGGADGLAGTLQQIAFNNTGGTGGALSIDNNGHLIYTPAANVGTSGATETFSYTVTDKDGDAITKQVTFEISDTGVSNLSATDALVDEDDIAGAGGVADGPGDLTTPVPGGTISYTLGADGNGASVALSATVGFTKLDGTSISTQWDPIGKVLVGYGTNPSDVVFRITLTAVGTASNAANSASYTVELLQPVAHPAHDEDGLNDGAETAFEDDLSISVTATVTDGDGSTGTTGFTVTIDDDVPVAGNHPGGSYVEGSGTQDLGVATTLLGINAGADGLAGTLQQIAFSNTGGTSGTLLIDNNGHLIYTPATNVGTSGATETFSYTVTDKDGDAITKKVTFQVTDTGVTGVGVSATQLVADEDDIAGANGNAGGTDDASPALSGTISYTLGGDAIGSVTLSTASDATGLQTLDGQAVKTAWVGSQLIGYVGADAGNAANQVFRIVVGAPTNTGASYQMTLLQPVKHSVSGTEDDTAPFTVDVKVTDADGSTGTTSFTVVIDDDTPIANTAVNNDPVAPQVTEGSSISGTWSQAAGADGLKEIVFSAGSQTQTVTTGAFGSLELNVAGGKVTFNDNGTWTFASPNNSVAADQNFTLGVKVVDRDGDEHSSSEVIKVVNSASPTATSAAVTADEDDLAAGNHNTNSDGDAAQSGLTGSLGSFGPDGAGSVAFGVTNGAAVTASGYPTVSAGGQQLFYHWDAGTKTLYGTTDTSAAAANAAFKVTLTGTSYEFTLLKPLDHKTAGTEDDIDISLGYTITDSNGDTANGSLSIKVDDDMPLAKNDTATVVEGAKPSMNVVLVIDTSGSMADDGDPNTPGVQSRLAMAKAAALNLLNSSGVTINQVMVVEFYDQVQVNDPKWGTWSNPADRADIESFINTRVTGGGTNYDAATGAVRASWGTGPTAADLTNVYFLSDGDPDPNSAGLDAGETTVWQNFLVNPDGNGATNDAVDNVYAVGIGSGVSTTALDPVAWANGNANFPPIVITDATQLSSTLTGTLPGSTTGNVLSNDGGFGADGGRILSIEVDGVTYTWNGANSIAKSSGGAIAGTSFTVNTATGGTFTFQFATAGGKNAGDWSYKAPASVTQDRVEHFTYVVRDGDGDTASANLDITVQNINQAPVGIDGVVNGTEDTTVTLTAGNFSFTDSDNHQLQSVIITTLPAGGQLLLNGVAVLAGATISSTAIAAGQLTYVPAANANGSVNLSFQVVDNGGTANGGKNTDTSPNTLTINLAAVNDAPTAAIAPTSYSATEQTNLTLHGTGLSIADVDAGSGTVTAVLSVTFGILDVVRGNSGVSVSGSGTGSVTLTGTIAQINNLLGGVDTGSGSAGTIRYNANNDAPPSSAVLTLTVSDGGNTGSGGTQIASDSATINITAVNDAAAATDDNVIVNIAPVDGSVLQLPNWALLANDDPDGPNPSLNIATVSNPSDLASVSLATNPGYVTVKNNSGWWGDDTDWGDFKYAYATGGKADVSISHDTVGAMDGTSSDDVMIDLINNAATEMRGNGGNDVLIGNGGNDLLFGGDGNDILHGGDGADTMTGGSGADTFVISADTLGAINDVITDFNPAEGDQIDLSELLKGIAPNTNLETAGYVKIEDQGNGTSILSVDVDGNTSNANTYQEVAVLQNFSYDSSGVNDLVKVLYENSSGNKNPDNV